MSNLSWMQRWRGWWRRWLPALPAEAPGARLLQMTEALPCVVFQFRQRGPRAGSFAFVGRPALDILGLSAQRLRDNAGAALEHVHPEDRRLLWRALARARSKRTALAVNYRVCIEGGERWVRLVARCMRQGPGGLWTGYWLDVNDHAKAHNDLRERERELRRVLESAPATIVVADSEGRVLLHNQTSLTMFGVTEAQLKTGGMRSRYVDAADRDALVAQLHAQGEAQADAVRMRRGDGSAFWARIRMSVGRFAGQRNAVFGWSVDITAEQEANEALRAAKELAEATAAAKSDFLANMSHEIRTPMNAIIGLAHLALQTPLDGRQRGYLQTITDSAKGLLTIVNDVLDFSHLEGQGLVLKDEDFHLDGVLAELASSLGPVAAGKRLELAYRMEGAVPARLRGDAARLGQVLRHLLGNAIKFTERGCVVLHCGMPDAGLLVFEVRDTGIGMDPATQARLFQPFQQADGSSTRRFGGMGLGLAICQRLVQAAGGSLTVDSTPGLGTRVGFTWPAPAAATAGPVAPVPLHAGLGALLIGPDHAARAALAGTLAAAGLAVDAEAQPADAHRLWLDRGHSVLLCDLEHPGADALAVLRDWPAAPGHPPPRRILVAARVDGALQAAAREAGIGQVLAKPVTRTALAAALAGLQAGAVDDTIQAQAAGAVQEPVAAAPDDPAAALRGLVAALETMDGDTHAQLERMAPWLQRQMGVSAWQLLQSHLHRFDFEEALAVLRQAPGLARWLDPA